MPSLPENIYHDWNLLGLLTDINDESLDLILGNENQRVILRCTNVLRFNADSFTIGNIVLDLVTFSASSENLESIFESCSFEEFVGTSQETPYFKNIVKRIKEGTLVYLELSPSYGCMAQVLCENVEQLNESI